jgi:hypothetical protein
MPRIATMAPAVACVLVMLAASGCASTTSTITEQRASASQPAGGNNEGPGSLSHAEDEQFCASHECIANFPNGRGTVVQCSDSKWSHSGGITGACADHGGEKGAETQENSPPEQSGEEGPSTTEGPGSLSHSEDTQFCDPHECIASFASGRGQVVQCEDGQWSHSGGISGACSDHGGERPGNSEADQNAEASAASATRLSPLEALNHYWADVRDHGFSEAYKYLAPSARTLSESQFVASERKASIENVQFEGTTTSDADGSADIAIVSLVTHDAEFGCRSWSGSYTMVEEGSAWRIARAAITPQSCSE